MMENLVVVTVIEPDRLWSFVSLQTAVMVPALFHAPGGGGMGCIGHIRKVSLVISERCQNV
jgi:hypothetical protein